MGCFSRDQLQIVRFCAIECRLQRSGPESVSDMVVAWDYAFGYAADGAKPDKRMIRNLGALVAPEKNQLGFRQCEVWIGNRTNLKLTWRQIDRALASLIKHGTHNLTPAEWFKEYEEIHPFEDGNGRVAARRSLEPSRGSRSAVRSG